MLEMRGYLLQSYENFSNHTQNSYTNDFTLQPNVFQS
jgi:hypothetical protein